jgi:RND family efflux transporter MFP subunit
MPAKYLAAVLLALVVPAAHADAFGIERQEMRAQLTPQRQTVLSAELGAKISRMPIKEGDRFEQGQLLIAFDCVLQQAQLDRAKSQMEGAQATLTGNRRLAELNSVGTVELQTSEAEVRKAAADVAYIQATLDKCEVHAPFPGRVVEIKAREQQFVQPGQPMLDILDDSVLELEFIAPSRWMSWLKPGHAFKVAIEETGKTYPVRLARVGAKADPVSQSVKMVAVVDGHFPELIAGMSGRILLAPPRR